LNFLRIKAVGGSTLSWAGVSLRLHETDFKMKSLYGLAEDWPISYQELEPYYGKAEIALGVAGVADNPFASHRSTDFPLPPFPFSYANQVIKKGCDKLGIKMHHVPYAKNSVPYQGRPPCLAYSTCNPVCPIDAQYNAEVHVRLAEATGRVKVIPDANVVRLNLSSSGRVGSVTYAALDKSEHEQKARVFVVAAHGVETARLLLLSRPQGFPNGLANSSGMVGKHFMEHPYTGVRGRLNQHLFPFRIGFHAAESHQFYATKSRDTIGAFKLDFQSSGGPLPRTIVRESGNWGTALKKEIQESFAAMVRLALC
jgi:choline dehydrogenase-like flavoprotein